MQNEEKIIGLGAGRLYLAPASVTEEQAQDSRYFAGPTRGGVTLVWSARIHEITAYTGRLVRAIRFGERVRLEGRLARLSPVLFSYMTGRWERERLPASRTRMRVVLRCALPPAAGGGEMVFSMIASQTGTPSLTLHSSRDSSYPFTLTAESDDAGMTGRLVFG